MCYVLSNTDKSTYFVSNMRLLFVSTLSAIGPNDTVKMINNVLTK